MQQAVLCVWTLAQHSIFETHPHQFVYQHLVSFSCRVVFFCTAPLWLPIHCPVEAVELFSVFGENSMTFQKADGSSLFVSLLQWTILSLTCFSVCRAHRSLVSDAMGFWFWLQELCASFHQVPFSFGPYFLFLHGSYPVESTIFGSIQIRWSQRIPSIEIDL